MFVGTGLFRYILTKGAGAAVVSLPIMPLATCTWKPGGSWRVWQGRLASGESVEAQSWLFVFSRTARSAGCQIRHWPDLQARAACALVGRAHQTAALTGATLYMQALPLANVELQDTRDLPYPNLKLH